MRRKATKQSPAANAKEKRFMQWVAEQSCVMCGHAHVIVEHMYGSTFKHNKVAIGHWALLPLCHRCDAVKTNGSHKTYLHEFGETQAQTWLSQLKNVPHELMPCQDVIEAIKEWNK